MARQDYFAILGLAPGRYGPAEVERQFLLRRRTLLDRLHHPACREQASADLDRLHVAYAALRDPARQSQHLSEQRHAPDAVVLLARRIGDALEDGLLRHSRREQIIDEARRIGLSEFQAHLLIAQVLAGDDGFPIVRPQSAQVSAKRPRAKHASMRLAAAGVLALAFFLAAIRWLGI
ncbi:hypothetical protein RAS1_25490 [Phycisphaerae bacterium RAS1]|nr:hypothetical protein RAS1_25490 [Phycisphaerae bacterium RAS1]